MISDTATLPLIWDLTRQPPTLGGALVLRMEAELLAREDPSEPRTIHVIGRDLDDPAVARLVEHVFATSGTPLRVTAEPLEPDAGWPALAERQEPGFSHFSFQRILRLHAEHGVIPRLRWTPALLAEAAAIRRHFVGRLVCVHLRSVAPFAPEESNADGKVWSGFFREHAGLGRISFLLLGDDPLPPGLGPVAGVARAADLGIPLAQQLALAAQADGFLGMASGLCTAANFSDTPHVVFKHPAHHSAAMHAELGEADQFPFSFPRQRLWRRIADRQGLEEALALILE
jgi:hypothetical protein